MDPSSITTGAFTLLKTCFSTGLAIKDFCNGAAIADTKIKALLSEVEGLTHVLTLMDDTLGREEIKSSLQSTGHIGSHWSTLSTCIQDGQKTLLQLQEVVKKVSKSGNLFDRTRKHMRLQSASGEISVFRKQIRAYKDTLQLSLQTVILWNQVASEEFSQTVLPTLNDIQKVIRRLASDFNRRISGLEVNMSSASADDEVLQHFRNLRNCVRSAATVVSSASTIIAVDNSDLQSDFGDCFPTQPGEPMLRWMASNTTYEFTEPDQPERILSPFLDPRNNRLIEREEADSDDDLELELIQSLLEQGEKQLSSKQYLEAEKHLKNCLSRIPSGLDVLPENLLELRLRALDWLAVLFMETKRYDDGIATLAELIALQSQLPSKYSPNILLDHLHISKGFYYKKDYAGAFSSAKRALKGYKKVESSWGKAGIGY
ncbi:uncharacterized protein LY89DRAFT_736918 [Mollisia scopiformis]|uniref:Azaphilone pigments biosynthesis cluster protein L N-terminal domain-containing protein n=1 Tax=Mollisia scopiformis TaxID=149040 RepID=A0A194X150_MOLSC|nr:uncharacterized protein LY89DRAFT_736918 [Mollisia scopiformis]KUJ13920.1 hypothetical protein LY89DRAFT_736918 [Mollisia scopiformis]